MHMSRITSFALVLVLAASGSMASADSGKEPPPPPTSAPVDDYGDSYGYAGSNGAVYPQPRAPMAAYDNGGYDHVQEYPARRDDRHDDEKIVGGGLLGGAAGAVAGTFIAGHGSRLAGGLIGGGVGALAGMAIGALISQKHHHHHGDPPTMSGDYGTTDETVMAHGHWVGSMTGSWNGGPVRTWQGSYDNTSGQPHWRGRYVDNRMGYDGHRGYRTESYGMQQRGYGYGEPMYTEMMVPSQPIITKTVTTRSYYVDVPVRSSYVYVEKRAWHPRPVHHYRAPICKTPPQKIIGS